MGTGTAIAKEIKEQILSRIKNGTPATQAANEHGVSPINSLWVAWWSCQISTWIHADE